MAAAPKKYSTASGCTEKILEPSSKSTVFGFVAAIKKVKRFSGIW